MPDPGPRMGGKRFAAIFGATGLVGRHLAQRLADGGFEGLCLSRGTEPAPYEAPPGFSWGSAPAKESLRVPSSAVLFSLVPISALPALVARIDGGDRLVALSTSSVLFKAESPDPHERDLARGLRRAEEEVQRLCDGRGIAWTIFRPTLIYDPGRDANVSAIADFVRRFGVFPIVRPGAGHRQPIHAGDVAQAMAAAADAPAARNALFGLPGGETLAYREMVRRIFEALGKRPRSSPPAARTGADGVFRMAGPDRRTIQRREPGADERGVDPRPGSGAGGPRDHLPPVPPGIPGMNGRTVRRGRGLEGGREPGAADWAVHSDSVASRSRYSP